MLKPEAKDVISRDRSELEQVQHCPVWGVHSIITRSHTAFCDYSVSEGLSGPSQEGIKKGVDHEWEEGEWI